MSEKKSFNRGYKARWAKPGDRSGPTTKCQHGWRGEDPRIAAKLAKNNQRRELAEHARNKAIEQSLSPEDTQRLIDLYVPAHLRGA